MNTKAAICLSTVALLILSGCATSKGVETDVKRGATLLQSAASSGIEKIRSLRSGDAEKVDAEQDQENSADAEKIAAAEQVITGDEILRHYEQQRAAKAPVEQPKPAPVVEQKKEPVAEVAKPAPRPAKPAPVVEQQPVAVAAKEPAKKEQQKETEQPAEVEEFVLPSFGSFGN